MNWLKQNWKLVAVGVALAILGIWMFDSIMGGLLSLLVGGGKAASAVKDSKAKTQASDQRQAAIEQEVEKAKQKTDESIAIAKENVNHADKPDEKGDALANRFKRRSDL